MNPVTTDSNVYLASFSCCSPVSLWIKGNQRLPLNIKSELDQMEAQSVQFKLHFRGIGSCSNGARDMEILPFPHKLGLLSVSLQ